MILTYYSNYLKCLYIPLHLSIIINSKIKDIELDLFEDSLLLELTEEICSSEAERVVIDFEHVNCISAKSESIVQLAEKTVSNKKNLLLVNCSEKVQRILRSDLKQYIKRKSKHFALSGNEKWIKKLDKLKILQKLDHAKNKVIADHLRSNIIKRKVYLASSNIYANKYIDIKKLFCDEKKYLFAIWLLSNVIRKKYEISTFIDKETSSENCFDAFVCSSSNGLALSSILSILFRKKIVYFEKLGPQLTIMNKRLMSSSRRDLKLLYVYDFYCLGTEFKMTKLISKLNNCSVVGGIGIAKHIDRADKIASETKVHSLFNINDDFDFKYKLDIYKAGVCT